MVDAADLAEHAVVVAITRGRDGLRAAEELVELGERHLASEDPAPLHERDDTIEVIEDHRAEIDANARQPERRDEPAIATLLPVPGGPPRE